MLAFALVVLGILAIVVVGGCSTNSPKDSEDSTTSTDSKTVEIKGFAFSPSEIIIKAGDTLTWTNEDSAPHTVTSNSGNELNSGEILSGETFEHAFATPGTYEYHCEYRSNMQGKITVE